MLVQWATDMAIKWIVFMLGIHLLAVCKTEHEMNEVISSDEVVSPDVDRFEPVNISTIENIPSVSDIPMRPVYYESGLNDSCENHIVLEQEWRHFMNIHNPNNSHCDKKMFKERWFSFKLNNRVAEIPSSGLKQNLCGTNYPLTLSLRPDDRLPARGRSLDARLCVYVALLNKVSCATSFSFPITIHSCGDFYIYFLSRTIEHCSTAICLKFADEIIPDEYLSLPGRKDEQERVKMMKLNISFFEIDRLSLDNRQTIATIEYMLDPNTDLRVLESLYKRLHELVLNQLNSLHSEYVKLFTMTTTIPQMTTKRQFLKVKIKQGMPNIGGVKRTETVFRGPPVPDIDMDATGSGPGKKRRNTDALSTNRYYKEENIKFIDVQPRFLDGILRVSMFLDCNKKNYSGITNLLLNALTNLNSTSKDLQMEGNYTVVDIYNGLPKQMSLLTSEDDKLWIDNWKLLVISAGIVLGSLLLLVSLVICIFLRNRKATSG